MLYLSGLLGQMAGDAERLTALQKSRACWDPNSVFLFSTMLSGVPKYIEREP